MDIGTSLVTGNDYADMFSHTIDLALVGLRLQQLC